MNAVDLLRDLNARGAVVTCQGGKLVVDAPAFALTAEDRGLLGRRKPELLAILEGSLTPGELPQDWYEQWEERAAITEYEGGLPRERAEALALRDTLEQMRRAGVLPRNDTCVRPK